MKIYDEFEIDISDKIIEVKPNLKDIEITPSKEEQIFESDGVNGYGNIKVEGANLQDKEITPKVEKQEIIADEEYLALNKVIVNPVTSEIDNNITPENIRRGVSILGVDGDLETVKPGQEKTITPTKEEQMIVPDEGFELNKVIINPIPLQVKEVVPSTEEIEVVPDEENLLLEKVIVKPAPLVSKEVVPKEEVVEVLPDDNSIGLEKVIVNPIPEDYIIPTGTATIDRNGTHNVRDVENIDVGVYPVLQNKEVTPSIEVQEVEADSEYYGLDKVHVNPIPNEFKNTSDANINAEDIKEGKIAYGVEGQIIGTHTEPVLGNKFITESGTYNPSDDNLDGYDKIDVQITPAGAEDYFIIPPDYNDPNSNYWVRNNFIKKFPDIIIPNDNRQYLSYFCSGFNASLEILPKIICSNNIKFMAGLFYECNLPKTVDLSGLDTSNVIDMGGMFCGCSNLIEIDASMFNTSNVVNMNQMFEACGNLKTLNITGWDTSKVTSFRAFLLSDKYLTNLDLSHFNVSSATDMYNMFAGCSNLESINLTGWNPVNLKNVGNFFQYCSKLTEVIGLEDLDLSSVEIMEMMFINTPFTELNLTKWNINKIASIRSIFSGCKQLVALDISTWDLGLVQTVTSVFSNCTALTNLKFGKNLGKAYSKTANTGNSNYHLNLSSCTNLSEESLINVLTNLYDLAGNGINSQKCTLGATNLAKLTSEQGQAALANAEAKGWVIA